MNWLLKRLADEDTYYGVFLFVLGLYALTGCLAVCWAINFYPGAIKWVAFLFLSGAALVGMGMRVAHNLAYAALHARETNE